MNTANKQLEEWKVNEEFLADADKRGVVELKEKRYGPFVKMEKLRKKSFNRYDRITKGKPVNPVTSFK